MTLFGRLLRNAGFSILANLLNRTANTILFILISRTLGPAEAGTYSLAISYFFIGARVASWGLNHLLTREVARRREQAGRYLVNFVILRAGLAITAIGAIAVLIRFLPYSQPTRSVILIVILAILPENISDICQALFMAFEKMGYLSVVAFMGAVIKLALGAYFFWQGWNTETVAIIYTGTTSLIMIANLAIALFQLTRPVWLFDWAFCRQQVRIAIPFVFVSVFFIMDNRLGIVLLSLLGNEEMVGHYSAAMTIVSALMMLPEGYRTAVFPVMAHFQTQSEAAVTRLYAQSFKYLLLLALPLATGMMLVANDVIALVYKPDFAPAGPVLSVIVWSLGFFFLNMINSRLLIVNDRQDLIARSLLVNTVVTVVLNVLLVPLFGVLGAAIAKATTAALLFVQYSLAAKRHLKNFSPWPYLGRPVAASALMTISVLIAHSYSLFIQIGVGAAVYLVTLVVTGTFPPEERTMWLQILSRRGRTASVRS